MTCVAGVYRSMLRTGNRTFFLLPGFLLAVMLLASGATSVESAKPEGDPSLTGKLLVAAPEMSDPRFVETVIYIVRDDREGTLGLVINRPLARGSLQDLLKGFGAEADDLKGEIVLHYGGPVSPNRGFLLHTDEVTSTDTVKVKDGLAMSSDIDILQAIGRGQGPKQYLFMIGYAGWAPGQLRGELDAGAWYVVTVDKSLIFSKDAEHKWQQAMDKRETPL